ncbi:MAG: ABC transporter permease [Gammaproteobacteria bacterium]|nr:ABC transporter permease [Gammaproteobacteria bacterium]
MTTNTSKPNLLPKNKSILPRTFKAAAWLGWQIESNWADPLVFAIYAVIKPLASAAILVVMYSVITNGAFENKVFPYIYLGNAFYIYVGAVMAGISWAVIDDREHYRMLKYMYVAPIHIPTYLVGRGVARFIFGSISVFITITFGVLFLKVPLNLLEINWGLFFISLFLGIVMLISLGLVLGSFTLIIANHVWFLGEGVAGALYLFSGAIFPLEVLPQWLRPIGYAMPLTYWLELMRRSLIGSIAEAFPTLARFSNLDLLGILLGLTVVFSVVAYFAFRFCDNRARELGYIDMTTNY